jgi:hypothetical protein
VAELNEGLQVFADSMSEAALIGAAIILVALAAAWAMKMFRDPGPGEGGLDVEEASEDESLAQT